MQKIVWERGVFLDNNTTKDIRLNCYAVHNFFVEVVYDAEHNVVTEVRSFKSGHSLDKYSNLNIFRHKRLKNALIRV
jgi:uncharacterized protein YlaI